LKNKYYLTISTQGGNWGGGEKREGRERKVEESQMGNFILKCTAPIPRRLLQEVDNRQRWQETKREGARAFFFFLSFFLFLVSRVIFGKKNPNLQKKT
jgi:hypothetical protein